MSETLATLLSQVELNKPVSKDALAKIQAHIELPDSYEEFLRTSNGLEGPIGNQGYIQLWPAENLIRRNQANQIEEFTPGIFFIGSNGGDTAYGLDVRKSSSTYGYYVRLPFISIDWNEVEFLGATFTDFILRLKEQQI